MYLNRFGDTKVYILSARSRHVEIVRDDGRKDEFKVGEAEVLFLREENVLINPRRWLGFYELSCRLLGLELVPLTSSFVNKRYQDVIQVFLNPVRNDVPVGLESCICIAGHLVIHVNMSIIPLMFHNRAVRVACDTSM